MKEPVIIEAYDSNWSNEYTRLRTEITSQIGSAIQRIDHIGSTAIEGMAAKPVIDIQISVADLNQIESVIEGLKRIGYEYRAYNEDLSKRYFRETSGMRRTHIHVREKGTWSEQFNLLFRDYLRVHERDRTAYSDVKYELANLYRDQRSVYVEGKTEIVWKIMRKANVWSQATGWKSSEVD